MGDGHRQRCARPCIEMGPGRGARCWAGRIRCAARPVRTSAVVSPGTTGTSCSFVGLSPAAIAACSLRTTSTGPRSRSSCIAQSSRWSGRGTTSLRPSGDRGPSREPSVSIPATPVRTTKPNALARQALTGSGDIDPGDGVLTVCLDPLPTGRATAAIAQLCEYLTATQTRYPGTDLILRYEVKTRP